MAPSYWEYMQQYLRPGMDDNPRALVVFAAQTIYAEDLDALWPAAKAAVAALDAYDAEHPDEVPWLDVDTVDNGDGTRDWVVAVARPDAGET